MPDAHAATRWMTLAPDAHAVTKVLMRRHAIGPTAMKVAMCRRAIGPTVMIGTRSRLRVHVAMMRCLRHHRVHVVTRWTIREVDGLAVTVLADAPAVMVTRACVHRAHVAMMMRSTRVVVHVVAAMR